jgi:hypothetical protein
MKKNGFDYRFAALPVLAVAIWALLAACSSQSGATPAAKESGSGEGVWTDFVLYTTSPGDFTPIQKQRFQSMSMGAAGFVAGVAFTNDGKRNSYEYSTDLQLRGVLMRESGHRDGLAIWKIEGQVLLPASARNARVWQTKVIEQSTTDVELAPQSFVKDYPVNQVLFRAVFLAVGKVLDDGVTRGRARIASMQYDSQTGRFRVRVEMLGAD